jgi:flagellar biosynthetic protein FliP
MVESHGRAWQRSIFKWLRRIFVFIFLLNLQGHAFAANNDLVQISINSGQGGGVNLSTTLQILLLFTVLSIAPAILIMATSFTRILIVLSFLRSALSIQQPANQILIGLALFLTAFIMGPTLNSIYKDAYMPLEKGDITTQQAYEKAVVPAKKFMLDQMKEKDLELFTSLSSDKLDAKSPQDLPLNVILPSFMLSELKIGFQMGLLILLPFLVIDMIVASILMALGMMMLPPPVVSLPIKLMIFVLVDGWTLVIHSVVSSFAV